MSHPIPGHVYGENEKEGGEDSSDETKMPLSQAVDEVYPRVNVPSIFSLEENPWGERLVSDNRDFQDE